jgi:5-formyltetrahydrofolate cyclo-ligase
MPEDDAPAVRELRHVRKQDIRAELRKRRAGRAASEGTGGSDPDSGLGLARTFAGQGPAVGAGSTVAAYLSRAGEPDTGPIRAALAARGVRVLVPWLRPDRDLDWVEDPGPDTLAVLRPAGDLLGPDAVGTASVLLIPALAVDTDGRRLGQGGGSYDRVLARVVPHQLVVACVHDDELVDADAAPLPEEAHDRRVDAVLTPTRYVPIRAADHPGPVRGSAAEG